MLITPAMETNNLRICPRLSLDNSQVLQKLPLQSQSSLASQIVCPISNQNGSKLSPLVPHILKVSKKMWFRIWTKVMADQRINVPRLTWFIPFIGGQAALPAERCYFRIQYLVLFSRRCVFHCAIKSWNNNRYTIQQLNISEKLNNVSVRQRAKLGNSWVNIPLSLTLNFFNVLSKHLHQLKGPERSFLILFRTAVTWNRRGPGARSKMFRTLH